MISHHYSRLLPPAVLLLLTATSGCFDTSDPIPVDLDEPDSGFELDEDGQLDTRFDVDTGEDHDLSEGEFTKPNDSELITFEPTDLMTFEGEYEEITPRSRRRRAPRPHMRTTAWFLESWLYEGEYFVLDGSYLQHNMWWHPRDYYVVALHQGRRLPVRMIEVEERYPSLDEIESWEQDEFNLVDIVSRDNDVAFNYTLVIPPWAFPEKGAYTIQVLQYPVWNEFPLAPFLAQKASITGTTIKRQYHYNYTIYYGSTEFTELDVDARDRQEDATTWETTDAGPLVANLNYQFLAPPLDLCDWTPHAEAPYEATCLGETLESSEPMISLDFFLSGGYIWLANTDTRGRNLYLVFRDDEIIDRFWFEPGEELDANDLMQAEAKGRHLSIEVELTAEPANYQIVAVPNVNDVQQQMPEGEHSLIHGKVPVGSNTIRIHHAPQ